MAIYTESVKDENVMKDLQFSYLPVEPSGFREVYETYKRETERDEKVSSWKKIKENFRAYLDAKDSVIAKNKSNLVFLNQMIQMFDSEGMKEYSLKANEILESYYEN